MPFPILPVLAGLASTLGVGASAYGLGTSIKDRNEAKKKQKQYDASLSKSSKGGSSLNPGPMGKPQGMPEGVGTYTVYSPEQQGALNFALQNAMKGLGNTPFNFDPFEKQAREGFAQQTVPTIAERFTAMGSGPDSGGFNRAIAHAGKGLDTDLAALKSNYNLQQQHMLQNLLGIGLSPQYEAYYRPGDEGFLKSLAQNLLTGENIGGAFNALKGLSGNKSNNSSGGVDTSDFQNQASNFGDTFSPTGKFGVTKGLNPTSSLGSFQAMTNPSNLVSGVKTPSGVVPGVGLPQGIQVPAEGEKMSRLNSLRGLFGI